ncbi:carbohydrate ABC transporter permease [Streptomyces aidingensis]|uniref:Raffinose/stachyose/melibiose transport system permease protein n=1 Tax=Streptomyces aidingensis TaxID=910347 RepID=A0A1I1R8M3_9ACTN|nr:carbohydrate ABC transporter permease [Streptomyces aidingensis]SFD26680.1 raffinose/stachyose/melibiose transport system permease protein [Streptomyces aidingensis]
MITNRWEAVLGRVVLGFALVSTLLPLLSMLSAALQPQGTIPVGLRWPSEPHWENFADAFRVARLADLLVSSLLIEIVVVPVALAFATLAGFALARLNPPASRVVVVLLLLGLTMPFESIVTPLYYQMQSMGLLNTRWAIILPLIGLYMPFGVIWMRAHFLGVPRELSEAARVDGAGYWRELRDIQLPLAGPSLSALAILLFLWTWNQYLLAIVLVDDPLQRTMAGALGAFQGRYGTDVVLLSAGTLLIIAPTIVVFVIFQRHFIRALLQGAVKG